MTALKAHALKKGKIPSFNPFSGPMKTLLTTSYSSQGLWCYFPSMLKSPILLPRPHVSHAKGSLSYSSSQFPLRSARVVSKMDSPRQTLPPQYDLPSLAVGKAKSRVESALSCRPHSAPSLDLVKLHNSLGCRSQLRLVDEWDT